MADKLMRAQVTIPVPSGIPEDAVTNTWYFDGDDGDTDAAYWSSVQTLLTTFYQAIDGVIYPNAMTGPATLKIYDMRDPLPRVPEYTTTIALTPTVGTHLPGEVAICLSYQAAAISGQSQKRRRGRIYLGPLSSTVNDVTGNKSIVTPAACTAIANAAAALENGIANAGVGSTKWAVYSPTTDAVDTLDNAFNDVEDGWVDNAWDIQRRRGLKATTRTLWT